MKVNIAIRMLAPHAYAVAVACSALCFIAQSPASAEDCTVTASTQNAEDLASCGTSEPSFDLDTALPDHTATITSHDASTATPWIAKSASDVPATVSPSDDGVSMRTSLGAWRDYNSRAASKSLDDSAAAPSFALPKSPAASKSPVDVWSSVDVQGYEGARDQSVRAGVGADVNVAPNTKVGVSAERGDAKSFGVATPEQDSKVSAYVALKASPSLSLEARSDWQAGNAEFAAIQSDGEKQSFSLTPRVEKSFSLGNGDSVAPYVSYTHQFDMSTVASDAEAAAQSAGAGVKYTTSNSYSLSVSTDLEGIGVKDAESLSSKVQLSVPIK